MKVVVIGCTHAGTAAVQEILNRDPETEVAVYERNADISFLSCGIYLYLGGVVRDLHDVFYATGPEVEAMGLHVGVHLRHDVTLVDAKRKVVEVQDLETGEKFSDTYDKLIVTTGSYPVASPIRGVNVENVFLCKNFKDAQAIKVASDQAKRIAVVGGGYIGVEIASSFAQQGRHDVLLINGRHGLLSHYVDRGLASRIGDDLRNHGVDLHDGEHVLEFDGDGDGRVFIRTDKGEIETDIVILCVGFQPMTELVAGMVDLDRSQAIIVNDQMQSSDPDIYATGDSTVVRFNPTGQYAYAPLATNAVRQGKIAGANIINPGSIHYMGTQSTSALSILEHNMATSGLTYSRARKYFDDVDFVEFRDNYRPEFMPTTTPIDGTLVFRRSTRQILGGQFYSKLDISMCANVISVMIQNKNTVDDLGYVDMLFNPNFDRPWNYMNLLGQAAINKLDQPQ